MLICSASGISPWPSTGPHRPSGHRRPAEFLFDLARKADKRDKVETSKRTIGGVFVLQNMRLWESLSACTCWPV